MKPIRHARRRLAVFTILLLLPALLAAPAVVLAQDGVTLADIVARPQRPRLVVVISIDQFRADYLRRFTDLFLPPTDAATGRYGGFRYLMANGAYYLDAHYGHFPLTTGPGHSVILTGGYPYKTGIVANGWLDRATRRPMYCVSDPTTRPVGQSTAQTGMGPRNLRSSTVGDELKLATAMHARVATISLKDRAAILLGGHLQDISLWFDRASGSWISSTAYCPSGTLPPWAVALNNRRIPDSMLAAMHNRWAASLAPDVLQQRSIAIDTVRAHPGHSPYRMGAVFPHRIADFDAFTLTPSANRYTLQSAMAMVEALQMGRDTVPDLLAINLSTNDYVGHAFGPYSPEALEITVGTDSDLAWFINELGRACNGLENVVIALTADHGVVPDPRALETMGMPAHIVPTDSIQVAACRALARAYNGASAGPWDPAHADSLCAFDESYIYLDSAAMARTLAAHPGLRRADIEAVAADAVGALPGIYACYTRSAILAGALPRTDIAAHITRGFHPVVSGDMVVVIEGLHLTSDEVGARTVTSHGTPYSYDTHVPVILSGFGVQRGVFTSTVSPADIAPTLCTLLGIEYPSACDGTILPGALR